MGLRRKPVGCRVAVARQPFRYLANSALGREETADERMFIPAGPPFELSIEFKFMMALVAGAGFEPATFGL